MKSLYVKFILITIGIMLFSFLAAFLFSNYYYQQNLKPANDAKNTDIALEVSHFISNNPEINLEEYLNTMAATGYQLYLVGDDSQSAFYGADFRETALDDRVVENVLAGQIYHGMLNYPSQTFVTGFFANELENTIGVPVHHNGMDYALFLRPDIELLFNEMHLLFGLLAVLTIALSIIFVFVSAHFLIRPVTQLSRATKNLAGGNYNVDNLDTGRRDEIGELSSSFVNMAAQIEYNDKMQKDFISNISHDIQSPLSSIKGYNQLLNKQVNNSEKQAYTETIDYEIDRLSMLTDQLLVLSSIDHEDHMLRKETYNLHSQLTDLIHAYEWRISSKGLMLSHRLDDVSIYADQGLLNTVWDNLLSNAVKYNTDTGSIDVELTEKDDEAIITISDTGIGIDPSLTEMIFERFYRIDTARTSHIGGSGLGLSIAKKIIDLHNGTIDITSDSKGTTFTIKLPLNHSIK
ncbi:sensor histidine kinase [Salinicoccus albus]|uniref:sensor histidine kinase n=1 Tax=Salinicoccus albus TaxID=418756 RepID=UPI00037407DA|nr:HAMP domain-containing sensor histidine kinase [Salinicoccus albus]